MEIIYKIYFGLPDFSKIFGLPGKAINKLLRFFIKKIFDRVIPAYLKRTESKAGFALNTEIRTEKYLVSLTSFPARIDNIWICIETILRQSFKPDKVILWLAEEQFPEHKLPDNLVKLQDRGLTIEYCKDDLKSHKKYFYALEKYPDDNIITVDDDVYYPPGILNNLFQLHKKFPNAICANKAHLVTFNGNGIQPYRKWKHNYKRLMRPSFNLLQTGVGGVLYPPNVLHEEVLNKKNIKKLCLRADDLWLNIMARKNGARVVTNKNYNKDFITILSTQQNKLVSANVFSGGNDKQLKQILDAYSLDITFFRDNESAN